MANYWLKEHDKAEPIGPYGGNLIKSFAAEKRIGPDWFVSSDQKSWQQAGSVNAHAPSMFARPSKNPVIRIEGLTA